MTISYYESAEGITITRERALQEVKRYARQAFIHPGAEADAVESFLADQGDHATYDAQAVLAWLGY